MFEVKQKHVLAKRFFWGSKPSRVWKRTALIFEVKPSLDWAKGCFGHTYKGRFQQHLNLRGVFNLRGTCSLPEVKKVPKLLL